MLHYTYIAYLINIGTRCTSAVSFTPRPLCLLGKSPGYPLKMKLGGLQSRSGRFRDDKDLIVRRESKDYSSVSPVRRLATSPTTISRTLFNGIAWNKAASVGVDVKCFRLNRDLSSVAEQSTCELQLCLHNLCGNSTSKYWSDFCTLSFMSQLSRLIHSCSTFST